MNKKSGMIDFPLFIVILILLAIGINMVFSASMWEDKQFYNDSFYHLKKQLIWAGLGIITMLSAACFDYKKLKNKKLILFGMIVTISLLVIVLFMPPINGSRRWIGIGSLGIQPSEIAKLMMILYASDNITRKGDKIKTFSKGILPVLIVAGMFALLIIKEPNMSTTVIIVTVAFILLFIGGANIGQLVLIFAFGVGAAILGIVLEPYRFKRFLAFKDPWADPLGDGYQAIQSLYALGSGGLLGVGLGQSHQKLYYIPEAQNDFIFSIIAEELGFIGVLFIIILFAILIWRGYKIALNCKDKFGSLMATGITSLIAVQSSINFLVVASFMPITGVTLPLISYGGSSLLFTMLALGVLLNISRQNG
ncbi:putative lipid II flippase FtsW [Caloramator sp. E03]|uniref:putative lipid II flippase FtsW n=1 Tax=Caloramator sp. E03 TaxID=2576307 RepID=UPI001110634B|nr:putative lipid II flippase FtsW [Caloramator sp. E03]QCX32582.1 putative lipid II flippase FtsW [Caloramator sp. E03]